MRVREKTSTPSKDFISGRTRCGQESRVNAATIEIIDSGGGLAVDMRSVSYDGVDILVASAVEVGGDGDDGVSGSLVIDLGSIGRE
jgi:hypothetical protein